MKYSLLLFFLIKPAFAWELKAIDKKIHLIDSAKKVDEVVFADTTEKVQVKKINDEFTLVTYFETEAGTKVTVKNYNCAVYSESKKKIVFKDKICRTVSDGEVENATFTPSGNRLIYKFEELTQTIE